MHDLTREELAYLDQHIPDALIRNADGSVTPKLSRAEVVALQARYPTMFPDPAAQQRSSAGAGAVLRARYPTMFAKQ